MVTPINNPSPNEVWDVDPHAKEEVLVVFEDMNNICKQENVPMFCFLETNLNMERVQGCSTMNMTPRASVRFAAMCRMLAVVANEEEPIFEEEKKILELYGDLCIKIHFAKKEEART